jgi:hypothetical protein
MTIFGFAGAWPLGFRLFAGRLGAHLVILAGIGVIVPLGLRIVAAHILGDPDVAALDGGSAFAAGGFAIAAAIAGYALQAGSFFASWRLGLGAAPSLGGAVGYGLGAGLLVMVAVGILAVILGAAVTALATIPGFAVLVGLVLLVPLVALCAVLNAVFVAAAALALGLLLSVTMVLGTATGNTGLAATLVGGSGLVVVALIVACGLALWLAARFCCAGPLMAERRSLNPIAAARASWALTIDEQGRIMAYLAVLGLGFAILLAAAALAIGASAAAIGMMTPATLSGGLLLLLLGLGLGVPVAMLSVAVPAGIRRALNQSMEAVAVFA